MYIPPTSLCSVIRERDVSGSRGDGIVHKNRVESAWSLVAERAFCVCWLAEAYHTAFLAHASQHKARMSCSMWFAMDRFGLVNMLIFWYNLTDQLSLCLIFLLQTSPEQPTCKYKYGMFLLAWKSQVAHVRTHDLSWMVLSVPKIWASWNEWRSACEQITWLQSKCGLGVWHVRVHHFGRRNILVLAEFYHAFKVQPFFSTSCRFFETTTMVKQLRIAATIERKSSTFIHAPIPWICMRQEWRIWAQARAQCHHNEKLAINHH